MPDFTNGAAWIGLSVALAAVPIVIKFCALTKGEKDPVSRVLGDGILYFYVVVLLANVAIDTLDRVSGYTAGPEIPRYLTGSLIVGIIISVSGLSIAYFNALRNRYAPRPNKGLEHALASFFLAIVILPSVAYFRGLFQLW